mmetsp:Transcript_20966/g.51506  ORF Transcript_20966/g.51506 Transcript_20966/m.51506 type:complete len:122 (+) Transcript_20966:432-797(+)
MYQCVVQNYSLVSMEKVVREEEIQSVFFVSDEGLDAAIAAGSRYGKSISVRQCRNHCGNMRAPARPYRKSIPMTAWAGGLLDWIISSTMQSMATLKSQVPDRIMVRAWVQSFVTKGLPYSC